MLALRAADLGALLRDAHVELGQPPLDRFLAVVAERGEVATAVVEGSEALEHIVHLSRLEAELDELVALHLAATLEVADTVLEQDHALDG